MWIPSSNSLSHVKDIHSVLEVTVYDEDRDNKVDFLGKVVVPLLSIRNGERRWYALKDKKLTGRAKGSWPQIYLEMNLVYNPIRASVRTFNPKEEKYTATEQKFNRHVFLRNVTRLRDIAMSFVETSKFVGSCLEWESPSRSISAFIVFLVVTYFFEFYMIPVALLLLFLKNYLLLSGTSPGPRTHADDDDEFPDDEGDEEDDKVIPRRFGRSRSHGVLKLRFGIGLKMSHVEEKKTLKERLQAIQEVTQTVQNVLGYIASLGERIAKYRPPSFRSRIPCRRRIPAFRVLSLLLSTFAWTVPFLSWLAIVALAVATVILYLVPTRWLVLAWGINKFAKKLVRPHSINNNELLDFLSRVPDSDELVKFRELRTSSSSQSDKRRDTRHKKTS
ncbi:unnamed protein product [Darwinula stevensoni]|uniref:Uncharacterized protein n=1 Tax=Darwinula stevensoni TaxID=69355 RepID=A0A7R9FRG2_9CRUS|nr:unnamed protein product [Darwinula stevensoni]CAG0900950.1 unnamed protein product [Darwinula stevensoni]